MLANLRPALAALLVGLALGAGLVLWLRPARVEVRTRELSQAELTALRTTVTVAGPERLVEGPSRVVERWYKAAGPVPAPAPGCAPCPACAEHERVTERGPMERDKGPSSTTSTEQVHETVRVERVTVESPRATWAAGAGIQLLPDRRLELALEHRLVGPFWVRAWLLQPAELALPALGVGLRGEW